MSLTTKVVVFGDVASDPGVQIFTDDEANTVGGEVKTAFYPGDSQYLLVIVPGEYRLVRVAVTDGSIAGTGLAYRTQVDRLLFAERDVVESLTRTPVGGVSPTFYGGSGVLSVVDGGVRAGSAPIIADVSYTYKALQYRLDIPTGLQIDEDEDYPIGVVVYVEAVQ